jgi:GAF domain-containing protein
MADQSALLRVFADYARTISRRYEIGEVLYRLTDQAVELLPVDGAGVSLGDPEHVLRFVSATDERVTNVEEEQVKLEQGPCRDAYRSGDCVTAADLAQDERWPEYRQAALAQGFASVAGIPLVAGEQRIGALNLYREAQAEWPADDLQLAQLLADMTTGYIINARNLSMQRQLAEQLQHALDSRIVIEQAKGILAERHGTDPARAFQALRTRARSSNARVHDVARGVVDGSLQL